MRVAYASMFSITWAGSGYFFPLSGIELTTKVHTHTHHCAPLCYIIFRACAFKINRIITA